MELEKIGKSRKNIVLNNEQVKDWNKELREYEQGELSLVNARWGELDSIHGESVESNKSK
jgi:hypothetical protein